MATKAKEKKESLSPAILAAKAAIANIEKQMGNKGRAAILRYGDDSERMSVKSISFGKANIDEASYCGGVPQGKIIEIFGPESSGKSLLSLWLMASAQKMGLAVLLIDVEQSFDPKWARKQGVDVENLFIINDMPDEMMTAERTLDYAVKACESGAFGLIVLDSTAALVPQKEIEGNIGDCDVALLARIMSKACRQIMGHCGQTGTSFIFINQIREKIGVMFGDSTTTPGGKALRFYSHQRINVIATSKIYSESNGKKVVVARKSLVKFVKNKVARPFGECEIEIVFDETLLNPVVRLCAVAKSVKVIGKRNEEFRVAKELSEDGKPIETHAKTMAELADYLVKNNLVIPVLNATIKAVDDNKLTADDDDEKVDDIIYQMQKDPSLIVAPSLIGDLVPAMRNEVNNLSEEATGQKTEEVSPETDDAIAKELSDDENQ